MANLFDRTYQNTLERILTFGTELNTRGTTSLYSFGVSLTHNMYHGFPASTLTNFYPKSAIKEMFNFDLKSYGEVSESSLTKGLRKVWSKYVSAGTDYVPYSYCENWRSWDGHYDQLKHLVFNLLKDPTSRSHVVQTFVPNGDYSDGGMPNCSVGMVFSSDGEYLDLMVNCRSVDAVTGLRGDFCRYAALLCLISSLTNLTPRFINFNVANLHIYNYAYADAELLIELPSYDLPSFDWIKKPEALEVSDKDWELAGYKYNKVKLENNLDLGDLSYYKQI